MTRKDDLNRKIGELEAVIRDLQGQRAAWKSIALDQKDITRRLRQRLKKLSRPWGRRMWYRLKKVLER